MVKKLCEEAIHRRKSGDCTWQTRHGNGGLLQREERLDAAAAHTSCAPCRCLRLCQFAACTAWHLWTLRWGVLPGMMASPSYLSRLSCPTRRDHKDHSEVVYELEMQLVPLLFRRQHAPIAHVQQKPCRVRTTSATVATEVELASAILPTLMVSARSSTRSSRACKRADRGCWADEKAGAEPVVPGAAAACLLL